MASGPKVVIARMLPRAGLDMISGRFSTTAGGDRVDRSWLLEHVPGAIAIVADPSVPVDAALLDAAGNSLKVVSNFGVGFDNIDLDAARARGVRATNTPDVLTTSTAELAVALMLAAGRRMAEADSIVRTNQWETSGAEDLLGRDLAGSTVGLVGFGRIWQRVASLLRGFDVHLLFHGRGAQPARHGALPHTLPELLAASDFVSLHVPLSPQTAHLIDAGAFALMKPGAILVNTSRGGVVDTNALIDALRSGRLAAAGLDVYEDEPQVPAELRKLANTVLLPHIGSATIATRDAMERLCAENLLAVIDGREPPAALV